MILADSSAWFEFDRATGSPTDVWISDLALSGRELATTEPVTMEVLAGARDDDDDERRLGELLGQFAHVSVEPRDYLVAATIDRRC